MSRRIGYARTSRRDQDPQLQLDALHKAGCWPIFHEQRSGAHRDRPELDKALAALELGDTLVTWKLDRLGRSLTDLFAILEDLKARGVGFLSLTEGLDTTTEIGRLILLILAWLAEYERARLIERTLAGLEVARSRGHSPGRKPKLVGAKRKMAEEMIASGDYTMVEVAQATGIARSTLYRVLKPSASGG